MTVRTFGILSMLLVCACSHQPNPASDTFKGPNMPGLIKRLEAQAPFELNCEAEKLIYKSLGGATVGVVGCGRRVTYKLVQGAGWVGSDTSEDAE